MNNKYLSLFIILTITFLASAIGGYTTSAFKEPWYSQIILPSFNPPGWVFGPIWTTLYILMSLAAWSCWNKNFNNKLLLLYFLIEKKLYLQPPFESLNLIEFFLIFHF